MTVPRQTQVSYSWDNANRLIGITQGSTSVAFQYDNANRRTQLTQPNGIVVAYAYDADSRVSGMTWTLAGNQIGDLEYAYDGDGRVTSKTGSMAATGMPAAVSGNTFNADNGMTAFNGTAMSYDANGNLTSDGTNTYTWDARNHLSAIAGQVAAGFVYGPLGRRMSKTINGTATSFLYDGLNPVQELQNGSPSANMLTGLGIDEYFQRIDSSGAEDYLTDALGSTLALADSSGTLQTSYTYEPFGNTTASGASSTNPFQFTGRENDATGLYFNRARYYSPTFQRFVAQDPIGFRGVTANLYAYVNQDPISAVDPLGLSGYFLRFFVDVGAGFEVGTNPDGTWFGTVDFGFGEDVAAGYDPNATSPGYGQNGPSSCSIGTFAQGGIHFGGADFGFGDETGTDFGPSGAAPYSSSGPSASASGPVSSGIEFGGSAGGRIGFSQ